VKLGVHLPQWGPGANRAGVLAVARTAEAVGLDSVWVSDHVVVPLEGDSVYPYASDGTPPFDPQDGFLEAFTLLAAVAGATERVELGTSVLVLPMRDPLMTAKVVATLDQLADGRVTLGLGAGWWAEEFAALGAPFRGRGVAFEECIEILRLLWRDGEGSYQGRFHSFDRLSCRPLPVQDGGPPLLIGGTTPRALERAGRIGDGWHAVGGRPEPLIEGIAAVRRSAEDAGRDPAALTFSTVARLPANPEHAERLRELAAIGIGHVVFGAPSEDPDESCRAIEHFAAELLPLVRDR